MFLVSDTLVTVSVAIGAVVVLGIVAYFIFSPTQRAKRRFKNTPLVPVSKCMIPGGPYRISGKLKYVETPIKAPMSNRPCAYFEFKVMEQRSSGKNTHWVTIIDHNAGGDFAVFDHSGTAGVELTDSKVLLTQDAAERSGTFNEATPELEAILNQYGHSGKGFFFNKNLRYTEGVLEEGEMVAVAGMVRVEEALDPSSGLMRKRPVFASDESVKLVITDNPKLTRYEGMQA